MPMDSPNDVSRAGSGPRGQWRLPTHDGSIDGEVAVVDAGPSDYWRRSSTSTPRSPEQSPPFAWRMVSNANIDSECPEDGPNDSYMTHAISNQVWASPNNKHPSTQPSPPTEPSIVDGLIAGQNYEQREQGILEYLPRSDQDSWGISNMEAHDQTGNYLGSYRQTFREIMGDGEGQTATVDGDEEFGALPSYRRDRLESSYTPSTSSVPTSPKRSSLQLEGAPGKRSSFIPAAQTQDDAETAQSPAFIFHPLRRLSAHLFGRGSIQISLPPSKRPVADRKTSSIFNLVRTPEYDDSLADLGPPTAMDIRGMIAVGTEHGYCAVYSFDQEVQCILGNEGSTSSVTTVTISNDQTYIAVGRASGNVHLYNLSNPSRPARTTVALTLDQVLAGRKEGHLQNSRILHIGFVGARHTSIVTGDEHGRSFWWSLGRVVGVESNDVIRMLGSYPDPAAPSSNHRKPSTLFAVQPLPLVSQISPRTIDSFNLSALLTPTKLVIVGIKPSPKTWYRRMREDRGAQADSVTGCVSWGLTAAQHPMLVYSWGHVVRVLHMITEDNDGEPGTAISLKFSEGLIWQAPDAVRALDWYDENCLLVITTSQLVLTKNNLQVGTLQHWNDRILACVQRGDFLSAIRVALTYYEGKAIGNYLHLPIDIDERKSVISAKIRELMLASLHWAFSPDRLTDHTHHSTDGRGVDLTALFEGLAAMCIEACLSIGDRSFLFDEAYEHFAQAGIHRIFLLSLEPRIFSGRLRELPPNITQGMIAMHEQKGELDLAEAVIWNVAPMSLDINQAIVLCEAHGLWDAMIHVYTRAIKDYVAPLVKLIGVVRDIQHHRLRRPTLVVGAKEDDDLEELAPNAYKLYAYIEATLSGLSYPSGESLPDTEGYNARADVYTFIFQGRTIAWPTTTTGGNLVLTGEEGSIEPPYPYLNLLLRFDTEAFLHSMDIAFEDPYLNDATGAINRQSIVNLMLDVMDPEYFHPGDITFLHIFVARNLPKYPQFLFIPPSTLHRILVSLAGDPDQSTREDRQLAAEYLLSAYKPHDLDSMLRLFEQAGFFRILQAAYRKEGQWARLISTLLRDPDAGGDEVFSSLDDIIRTARASPQVRDAVIDILPHLFDLGVRETALLVDRDLPDCHTRALELLDNAPHKQLAYLRCLLEPDVAVVDQTGPLLLTSVDNSHKIDRRARQLYISLLCQQEPERVVPFLDKMGADFLDLPVLSAQSAEQGNYQPQMWALDRQGRTQEALEVAGDLLRAKGDVLGKLMLSPSPLKGEDALQLQDSLQAIQGVSRMAVRLCQENSVQGKHAGTDVEDMWLGVLHDIIELVHSASSAQRHHTKTDEGDAMVGVEGTVTTILRSLVQETLASLLSSSSSSLSFPRLFKRLVDASNSTSTTNKGRAYSEFRTILSGMLDSYRTEREMLGMTTRLVEADLHQIITGLIAHKMKGWRPNSMDCRICKSPAFNELGDACGLVVQGSGLLAHRSCVQQIAS
ncbi:hypothetical protein IAU59_000415 [Kwoniella sp. CBS 9459]